MNLAFLCAQLLEDPKKIYTSESTSNARCLIGLPPIGNKAVTRIQLTVYGKQVDQLANLKAGHQIYLHGSKLRYDIDTKEFRLEGGNFGTVSHEYFPVFNTVILSGRCIKNINKDDERDYKVTPSGLMICNQSLSVNTGRNQSDIFNFYAINSTEDRNKLAELLKNFTRKGVGLTVQGRLLTDEWKDKMTGQGRSQTKIQLIQMTLGPKTQAAPDAIEPKTNLASGTAPETLWGNQQDDSGPAIGGLPGLDQVGSPWGEATEQPTAAAANVPSSAPEGEDPPF
jgi:single-stranded DNA-binding protein|tara:strand:- start:965 stop:1813 length:849 start_codon:yes stop_codon:yes gene_type:complete